jgi:uncharacterized RDD family membrane protein YckC
LLDIQIAAALTVAALFGAGLIWRNLASDTQLRLGVAAGIVMAAAAAAGALATSGRTPSVGQSLVGITVITHGDGEAASFGRGIVRGTLLVVLEAAAGFATWSVLWHPRRRGWHDRLSGTTVVVGRVEGGRLMLPLALMTVAAAVGAAIVGATAN